MAIYITGPGHQSQHLTWLQTLPPCQLWLFQNKGHQLTENLLRKYLSALEQIANNTGDDGSRSKSKCSFYENGTFPCLSDFTRCPQGRSCGTSREDWSVPRTVLGLEHGQVTGQCAQEAPCFLPQACCLVLCTPVPDAEWRVDTDRKCKWLDRSEFRLSDALFRGARNGETCPDLLPDCGMTVPRQLATEDSFLTLPVIEAHPE